MVSNCISLFGQLKAMALSCQLCPIFSGKILFNLNNTYYCMYPPYQVSDEDLIEIIWRVLLEKIIGVQPY